MAKCSQFTSLSFKGLIIATEKYCTLLFAAVWFKEDTLLVLTLLE